MIAFQQLRADIIYSHIGLFQFSGRVGFSIYYFLGIGVIEK